LYSPDLAPADFWLFPELRSVLCMILKAVLNSGQSTGNIVKNWREITLKNYRLLISAALKINF
jgi:hypothetical protein